MNTAQEWCGLLPCGVRGNDGWLQRKQKTPDESGVLVDLLR